MKKIEEKGASMCFLCVEQASMCFLCVEQDGRTQAQRPTVSLQLEPLALS